MFASHPCKERKRLFIWVLEGLKKRLILRYHTLNLTRCRYTTEWFFCRSCSLSNKHLQFWTVKQRTEPSEDQRGHKHLGTLSSVYQRLLSQQLICATETDTDGWASCQWSVTITSVHTHLPPPKNLHEHTLTAPNCLQVQRPSCSVVTASGRDSSQRFG